MKRASGVLMHISSLPEKYGIGTFGLEAYEFARALQRAGQKYWQILPLGPTGYGDSPYQSFSTFALNPYFIDLDTLAEEGLLQRSEYENLDFGNRSDQVDYYKLYVHRFPVLRKAWERGRTLLREEFEVFRKEEGWWLEDYGLFMAIKEHLGGKPWQDWEEDIRRREEQALRRYRETLSDEIEYWCFLQFLAYRKWLHLKGYINSLGIQVIGDLPIYTALDSVDTWVNSKTGIFKFDENLVPTHVAGCPPDYFSADGQYWGNPVFDWARLKETGYDWWLKRIGNALRIYDVLRIDHFRGFESYWEIPYGAPTAASGYWVKGPEMDFIHAVNGAFGADKIVAEDLGTLTEECKAFLKESGYPGMKVLEFAFDSNEQNDYLPHNYEKNAIVYTGTHDNDTIVGWWNSAEEADKKEATAYLGLRIEEGINRGFMKGAWSSAANLAIAPMQDLLGLGSEARMNIPSVAGGNWTWRMKKEQMNPELLDWLRELTRLYGRI